MPRDVRCRLDELAGLAVPTPSGLRWPVSTPNGNRSRPPATMTGWCNGTAGHLQLWTAAHRSSGDDRDDAVAERVARELVDSCATERTPFLCCGTAGAAYALLGRHRATGDEEMLGEARRLAERSLAGIRSPRLPFLSLYRGAVGVAVLASDLAHPSLASMPMFGPEHAS
jgi:serine/threonine-protein kinase